MIDTTTIQPGDRVYHTSRKQHGTWLGLDEMDAAGATSWVRFDGDPEDEAYMVSTVLLTLDA